MAFEKVIKGTKCYTVKEARIGKSGNLVISESTMLLLNNPKYLAFMADKVNKKIAFITSDVNDKNAYSTSPAKTGTSFLAQVKMLSIQMKVVGRPIDIHSFKYDKDEGYYVGDYS